LGGRVHGDVLVEVGGMIFESESKIDAEIFSCKNFFVFFAHVFATLLLSCEIPLRKIPKAAREKQAKGQNGCLPPGPKDRLTYVPPRALRGPSASLGFTRAELTKAGTKPGIAVLIAAFCLLLRYFLNIVPRANAFHRSASIR
jgi:hypothetical protein